MNALLLTLACLAPSAPTESPLFRALGWAVWATNAADLASTELALAQGHREWNPLVRDRAVRIGGKLAMSWITNYCSARLWRRGNTRAAKVFRAAVIGVLAFAATRNVSLSVGW